MGSQGTGKQKQHPNASLQPEKREKIATAGTSKEGEGQGTRHPPKKKAPPCLLTDSEDLIEEDIVNVDFEFFDPKPGDYHGLKALLRSYLDDIPWDLSGFVDIIVAQTTVGTVIKTAEDESPIGLITVLNMGRYKDHRCMIEIKDFLHRKCNKKQQASELEAFLEEYPYDVGLLVSERLINLPPELTPPLHEGLFDEVSWATEDEPSQVLRDAFKFKYYLVMTRLFQELPKEVKGRKRKTKEKEISVTDITDTEQSGGLIYVKPEDEILHKISAWSCVFPVKAESLAAHEIKGMRQARLVMAVSADEIPSFRSQLSTFVQECAVDHS